MLFIVVYLFFVNLRFKDSDIGKVTVVLGIVETVADDEGVGNLKAAVIGGDICFSACGLIQQGSDLKGTGLSDAEPFLDISKSGAAVKDILNDKQVVILDRLVKVKDYTDLTAGNGSVTVRGNAHKINFRINGEITHKVCHKGHGAFENTYEKKLFSFVIFGNLLSKFLYSVLDLLLCKKDMINSMFEFTHKTIPPCVNFTIYYHNFLFSTSAFYKKYNML